MATCIFCEIVAGRVPCRQVHGDEEFLAFHDVQPQAPTHVLVIPRRHIASTAALTPADEAMMGRLALLAARLAADLGLEAPGYRWVVNCGPGAGQTVPHLHLHLLGGRPLGWPPG